MAYKLSCVPFVGMVHKTNFIHYSCTATMGHLDISCTAPRLLLGSWQSLLGQRSRLVNKYLHLEKFYTVQPQILFVSAWRVPVQLFLHETQSKLGALEAPYYGAAYA